MQKYKKKIVVSGKIVELWEYDNYQYRGLTQFKKNRKVKKEVIEKEKEKKRSKKSNQRSKKNIRNWVNSNPQLNYFLTLTFAENEQDVEFANYEFKKFVKKIKYYIPSFQYVGVLEFQKRGAIHYHLVCSLGNFVKNLEDLNLEQKKIICFKKLYSFIKS